MMRNIKIIAFSFCFYFGNFCFGQTIVYTTASLNVRNASKNNIEFGIIRTGTGSIEVKVYDKISFLQNIQPHPEDRSFLVGFKSNSNTTDNYDNISWDHWLEAPYFYCDFPFYNGFYCNNETFKVDSNDEIKFKHGILSRASSYFYSSSAGFYVIDENSTVDVIVEVVLYGSTQLDDIVAIKIPGLTDELTSSDFTDSSLLDKDHTVEVYREDDINPKTIYTLDEPLVFYEGDSVVFKSTTDFNINGLTDLAIQRYAGESIFMSNAVKQGAHKPFLFYDSNVHGIKMRTYPKSWENGNHKYPKVKYDESQQKYSLYWIANTRRDYLISQSNNTADMSAFKNKEDFDISGFTNQNKFSGNTESLQRQRNNQKEGLNVQILQAYLDGKKGVAGLDPDELIYKNFNRSNISSEDNINTTFNYVTGDEWKKIDSEFEHINSSLQWSLNEIGKIIDPDNYYDFEANEILDSKLYRYYDFSYIIDGRDLDLTIPQPWFNHKKPVNYHTFYWADPIFHEDSELEWVNVPSNDIRKTMNIAVLSPLEGKMRDIDYDQLSDWYRINPLVNFYGKIEEPIFIARHQENVSYSVDKLPDLDEVPGKFELVYTNEDSNGFLTSTRKQVHSEDNTLTIPEFGGGGYHEITLQYTRSKSSGTPVIIAGQELLDIDLRFIFAPDSENSADFSNNPSETFASSHDGYFRGVVKLSEQKGNGNRWFLSSQSNLMQHDDYGLTYGYEDHNVVRTYVLNNLESIKLTVLDADPHTFMHYQPDWYLSERRLSKRIPDFLLENEITWYASKDKDFTSSTEICSGKHCNVDPSKIYPNYDGSFYVKAEFNGTSKIMVKIVVRGVSASIEDIIDNDNENLGIVKAYPLNDNQFAVLRRLEYISGKSKDDFMILKIQDIFSTYTYGAVDFATDRNIPRAPRYTVNGVEVGEHKRFSPQNNFDARFEWKIYNPTNGQYLENEIYLYFLYQYLEDPTIQDWFPQNWIRHLDGTPQSPEIPNFINTSYIRAFEESANPNIEDLNNNSGNLYEPWQVRLPWIAQTGVHGYKTRWNIKTIFDIDKIFSTEDIGTAHRDSDVTADSYQLAVNGTDGSNIIPGFDGDAREKQEFFQHLKAGRMVILRLDNYTQDQIKVLVTNNVEGEEEGTEIFDGIVTLEEDMSRTVLNKDKINLENSFNVYPNPGERGIFNLHFSTAENSLVKLELFDIYGNVVYKKEMLSDIGSRTIQIGEDLDLKRGVYILKVNCNGKIENIKLIVE